MALAQLNVTWEDAYAKTGVFGFLIDAAYDDGVYAEILAFLQDMLDASQAKITKVLLAKELVISSLTGNAVATTGSYDRIDDQAVLAFRAASGLDVKLSIPAPVDSVFQTTGAHAQQDVNPADATIVALILTGITEAVLASRAQDALTFRKGWRKGQKHS